MDPWGRRAVLILALWGAVTVALAVWLARELLRVNGSEGTGFGITIAFIVGIWAFKSERFLTPPDREPPRWLRGWVGGLVGIGSYAISALAPILAAVLEAKEFGKPLRSKRKGRPARLRRRRAVVVLAFGLGVALLSVPMTSGLGLGMTLLFGSLIVLFGALLARLFSPKTRDGGEDHFMREALAQFAFVLVVEGVILGMEALGTEPSTQGKVALSVYVLYPTLRLAWKAWSVPFLSLGLAVCIASVTALDASIVPNAARSFAGDVDRLATFAAITAMWVFLILWGASARRRPGQDGGGPAG